jgi:putative YhdH/YhfP family quinone oxidoreductase
MSDPQFECYLVEKNSAGQATASVAQRTVEDLPEGDVLIRVEYSSLNYKDALSATGHPGVTRKYPHVPGIDAAGIVAESRSPRFKPPDAVLVTGYDLGANRWGGYAGYVRVPADWVVPLPAGVSTRESMIYGTAGFTAGLSLAALQRHEVTPDRGEVVVTGASGGVGSLAVALLSKLGYRVAAVTGKPQAAEFLRRLGAARVIGRDEVNDQSSKPLLSACWAGAVDTVGGNTLATLLRSTERGGCVTACGLVGGADLPMTVYPFILRGVVLVGIDSAECPMPQRQDVWSKLAGPWKPDNLDLIAQEVNLSQLGDRISEILAGRIQGRIVVRPEGSM